MIENIYDGIQRPLEEIMKRTGSNITRGIDVAPLDHKKLWSFTATAKVGDKVMGGDILGTVPETPVVLHKIMVPVGVEGTVESIKSGDFNVDEVIATVRTAKGVKDLTMIQRWPVRVGRPYKKKFPPQKPLCSGQRIIDTLFPIAKGGTAARSGPFGSGKTVVQHQLAKWSDVDIVVYIGCGERGNEMTDVLREFPELQDPRTGESLMKRTSSSPTPPICPWPPRGVHLHRHHHRRVLSATWATTWPSSPDSTSRWAEALREMSGRLEEMPGEEGYPAYLASRIAEFYERAGVVSCMGTEERTASLTAVGAVSPPGGDLSEPVSQGTMRIVKVFWSLDAGLAYRRHFPAINWLNSYSLYLDALRPYYDEHIGREFALHREKALSILQEGPTSMRSCSSSARIPWAPPIS
jgi:V/A-type H+-transporting ATPase subunit A